MSDTGDFVGSFPRDLSAGSFTEESWCQSEDSSSDEWNQLARGADAGIVAEAEAEYRALREQYLASFKEKERIIDEKQEFVCQLRKRFIWDLSFAMKQRYAAESKNVGPISLSKMVNDANKEEPGPSEWTSWISSKFDTVV